MDIRKIAYGRYQLDWMAEKGYKNHKNGLHCRPF